MSKERNILLCVTGMTPQIITETLQVLTARGERIDEVRIITTAVGQEKILKSLLDEKQGKFYQFCRDHDLNPQQIRFDKTSIAPVQTADGRTLDDIRKREENERAADRICEIVYQLTSQPDTKIHASVAGGRKTMGIYLATAMQLFGRRQDEMSHVLVNEPFENHPDFYYKPPTPVLLDLKDRQGNVIGQVSTEEANIELAHIPFVRLRGVLEDWLSELPRNHNQIPDYHQIIQQTQDEMDLRDAAQELHLNCAGSTVRLLNQVAELTKREFYVYLLMLRARKVGLGAEGFLRLTEITLEMLDGAFREISKARGKKEKTLAQYEDLAGYDFLKGMIRNVSQLDKSSLQLDFGQIFPKINKKLDDANLPERCLISPEGKRGDWKYGVKILADRIHWQ